MLIGSDLPESFLPSELKATFQGLGVSLLSDKAAYSLVGSGTKHLHSGNYLVNIVKPGAQMIACALPGNGIALGLHLYKCACCFRCIQSIRFAMSE